MNNNGAGQFDPDPDPDFDFDFDDPHNAQQGVTMQGIVFVYDAQRSVRNRAFTIRIEERKKAGPLWVPAGPKRCYTAGELQRSGLTFMDTELYAMAFKSETEMRKLEGRFYSAEEEYTLYRISPYDLKAFLDGCFCSEVLCREDGRPVHFDYADGVVPEVGFRRSGDGATPTLLLQGRKVDAQGYEMVSNPVRIFSGGRVYELARGIPAGVVRKLIRGALIPHDEVETVLQELSQYAGKIDLNLSDEKRKRVLRNAPVTPVFDLDETFRFARLGYRYEGFDLFAMGDDREVAFNPKDNIELHRDFEAEGACRRLLEGHGALYRPSRRGEWFVPQGKREELLHQLKQAGFLLEVSGTSLILDLQVAWEVRVREGRLQVGGAVRHGDRSAGLGNILDAYLGGQPWFDLPGGSRGYIQRELLLDLDRLEERGDFKDEEILFEVSDFHFVADLFSGRENVSRDSGFREYLDFLEALDVRRRQPPPSTSLRTELRPYQRVGFNWLAGLQRFGFGGILADDMGLGKTLQVLALLLHLKESCASPHVTLLVLPKTLIWNWMSEIETFAPSLRTKPYAGPRRHEADIGALTDVDLVVTSYGLVRQDIDLLSTVPWDLVVLDEAQAVKNPGANISKSVRRLKAANRLALTGTPIENRPLDLWSLFDFLMPGFLGDKASFKKRYEQKDREALHSLGTLTRPFILRRLKRQVCDELPAKTEVTLFCDFGDAQRAFYDEILMTGKAWLADNPEEGASDEGQTMQVLTLLLRLRQAACHPALITDAEGGAYHGASGKSAAILETALDILAGGYKILLFSQFVAHLELVGEMFASQGIETHRLYGATLRREAVIDQFKRSRNPCVFLISLKTGGVGLNLTEAGYVFLLDPWWNPAVENQAIDRSYRIGQKNPVTVYRFITKDSVEERVGRLKDGKKRVERAVLEQGDGKPIPFSRRELLELVQ